MTPGTKPKKNFVGRYVRQVRITRDLKMTQEALAAKCQRAGLNLSREIIAQIEGGTRKVSDIEIKVLAEALGVTVQRLFGK